MGNGGRKRAGESGSYPVLKGLLTLPDLYLHIRVAINLQQVGPPC